MIVTEMTSSGVLCLTRCSRYSPRKHTKARAGSVTIMPFIVRVLTWRPIHECDRMLLVCSQIGLEDPSAELITLGDSMQVLNAASNDQRYRVEWRGKSYTIARAYHKHNTPYDQLYIELTLIH